ncbi:MAG: PKD domain-containing protein [Anaerolineae bacterium]
MARLNGPGTGLVYSTLLGGGDADYGRGLALDAAGSTYVAGATRSADFPTTPWAFDRQYDGGWDGFVAKLGPLGNALAYAAFVGGSEDDWGQAISVDTGGYAYLVGSSQTAAPTTAMSTAGGGHDLFVARIDEFGAGLAYSSVLGSSGADYAAAIAVDALGSVYLVGMSQAPAGDLTAGGIAAASPSDGFVSRLAVGTPFLDLPLAYDTFALAALGNVGDRGPGRVNSWFDHSSPTHTSNRYLTRWDGMTLRFNAATPPRIGESWYDGHGGTDFRWETLDETILAAAPGIVIDTITRCRVGNPSCGGGFGNRVWLDHGNGYATVYAHLKSVAVTPGTEITDPATQPLGIMGNTGRSLGTHLHFGVYYDANGDGRWTRDEVVDPYGWAGEGDDPWQGLSYYLWKYPLTARALVGSPDGQAAPPEGWRLASPSGLVTVTIPSTALDAAVVLELGDMPPAAAPKAGWRSTGHSFSLVEAGGRDTDAAAAGPLEFARSVTVTMKGRLDDLPHLDAGQLTLRRWDAAAKAWRTLPSDVDAGSGQITAQTSELGRFDLHAPLLCPADVQEPDDHYGAAQAILADGGRVVRLFDIKHDVDWFLFEARAGRLYRAEIRGAVGVDPLLQMYDSDTVAPLGRAVPAGQPGVRQLLWRAPLDGTYLLQASQAEGSAHGCDAIYELTVSEVQAPASVTLDGPEQGSVEATYAFTVRIAPTATTLPLSYAWHVDGQAALAEGQSLEYTGSLTDTLSLSWMNPGSYRLVVTATNAAGSASAEHTIVIQPPVAAAFSASPTSGAAPLKVSFSNNSEGEYVESVWDLGDGSSSQKRNPTHTYELPGVYTVVLTVSGPGGRDARTRTDYIRVTEPTPVPPSRAYKVYLPLMVR